LSTLRFHATALQLFFYCTKFRRSRDNAIANTATNETFTSKQVSFFTSVFKFNLKFSSLNMNEFIPNRYKVLQKIGEGVHGVVLKAIDTTQGNKVVAIKKVPLRTKFGGEWKV
jgi:serine/threonine protein kinase